MFLHLPKCLELSTDVAKQSLLNTEVNKTNSDRVLSLTIIHSVYFKEKKNQGG